jgi:hypothetical protein
MEKVDMSAQAVTARLKRVSQLRRLGLSLQKAKLGKDQKKAKADPANKSSAEPNTPESK